MAATCLHMPQSVILQSSPTVFSFLGGERAFSCRFTRQSDRSTVFGEVKRLARIQTFEIPKSRRQTIRRASSASFDNDNPDEEFAEKLQELAMQIQHHGYEIQSGQETRDKEGETSGREENLSITELNFSSEIQNSLNIVEPPWLRIRPEPPDWAEHDVVIPANMERKANSMELPLSLRILKKKKQWQDGFRGAGESACCSVKKAFSSMVFIIHELHSYTLQLREALLYQDLQGILARVQSEILTSFVWLFEQIFSQTPTLMMYLMILLANFTVYSMGHNVALAADAVESTTTELVDDRRSSSYDSTTTKSGSLPGKASLIGGGDGGKVRPVSGATDGGDGWFKESTDDRRAIIPRDVNSALCERDWTGTDESVSETEMKLWNSMVEEASRMQACSRDEALDEETMQRFVSPVKVEMEPEDHTDYLRTELMYQHAVLLEPDNTLLLTNYAQFLFLVAHDHDRAEEYYKRAVAVVPPDPEALTRYANFLWLARKDDAAAEEMYVKAIEADDNGNTVYAANYANFLWNSGGVDTCYPVSEDASWA